MLHCRCCLPKLFAGKYLHAANPYVTFLHGVQMEGKKTSITCTSGWAQASAAVTPAAAELLCVAGSCCQARDIFARQPGSMNCAAPLQMQAECNPVHVPRYQCAVLPLHAVPGHATTCWHGWALCWHGYACTRQSSATPITCPSSGCVMTRKGESPAIRSVLLTVTGYHSMSMSTWLDEQASDLLYDHSDWPLA